MICGEVGVVGGLAFPLLRKKEGPGAKDILPWVTEGGREGMADTVGEGGEGEGVSRGAVGVRVGGVRGRGAGL